MILMGMLVTFTMMPQKQETRIEGTEHRLIYHYPWYRALASSWCHWCAVFVIRNSSLGVVTTEAMLIPNHWPSLLISDDRKTWQSWQEVASWLWITQGEWAVRKKTTMHPSSIICTTSERKELKGLSMQLSLWGARHPVFLVPRASSPYSLPSQAAGVSWVCKVSSVTHSHPQLVGPVPSFQREQSDDCSRDVQRPWQEGNGSQMVVPSASPTLTSTLKLDEGPGSRRGSTSSSVEAGPHASACQAWFWILKWPSPAFIWGTPLWLHHLNSKLKTQRSRQRFGQKRPGSCSLCTEPTTTDSVFSNVWNNNRETVYQYLRKEM